MGWSFYPSGNIFNENKKEFAESLVEKFKAEDYSLKPNKSYQATLYMILRTRDQKRYIAVFFLDQLDDGGWGYKDMDESVHPCTYDCPKRLLDKSDVPDESGWRHECHKFRLSKRVH